MASTTCNNHIHSDRKNPYSLLLCFLLTVIICLGLTGCKKDPTVDQQEIVNRLIQEQLDIPYEEPNWDSEKNSVLRNDKTIKEVTERSKKSYSEVHDFLIALKNKHYRDKKDWAINFLKLEIRAMEQGLKALVKPDKELVMLIEQRKKWLTTLNEK